MEAGSHWKAMLRRAALGPEQEASQVSLKHCFQPLPGPSWPGGRVSETEHGGQEPTSQGRRWSWSRNRVRTWTDDPKVSMTLFHVASSMRWVPESTAVDISSLPSTTSSFTLGAYTISCNLVSCTYLLYTSRYCIPQMQGTCLIIPLHLYSKQRTSTL